VPRKAEQHLAACILKFSPSTEERRIVGKTAYRGTFVIQRPEKPAHSSVSDCSLSKQSQRERDRETLMSWRKGCLSSRSFQSHSPEGAKLLFDRNVTSKLDCDGARNRPHVLLANCFSRSEEPNPSGATHAPLVVQLLVPRKSADRNRPHEQARCVCLEVERTADQADQHMVWLRLDFSRSKEFQPKQPSK
jgi:hypothetical protein